MATLLCHALLFLTLLMHYLTFWSSFIYSTPFVFSLFYSALTLPYPFLLCLSPLYSYAVPFPTLPSPALSPALLLPFFSSTLLLSSPLLSAEGCLISSALVLLFSAHLFCFSLHLRARYPTLFYSAPLNVPAFSSALLLSFPTLSSPVLFSSSRPLFFFSFLNLLRCPSVLIRFASGPLLLLSRLFYRRKWLSHQALFKSLIFSGGTNVVMV